MALEQKLNLKLAQRLVMTPSLQQAIKLLQLSRLELGETLNQEILENPLLDVDGQQEDAATADYREYARSLSERSGDDIRYRALYIYGPEDIVGPLTKNLSWLS